MPAWRSAALGVHIGDHVVPSMETMAEQVNTFK
jgi:hypothetical protein